MSGARIMHEHLNREGLRVSGKHEFPVSTASHDPDPSELPDFDLGIVATKATQVEDSIAASRTRVSIGARCFRRRMGWAAKKSLPTHTRGHVIRGTTFMSGTRHSDTHVQYELDTATWMGPFEPRNTPFAVVEEAGRFDRGQRTESGGAEDARPAQWSKLIFNASVNGVSALTGLPHSPHFADEVQIRRVWDICCTR